MRNPCVYILASKRNGVHVLVYAEFHETMLLAIAREKQLKKWRRAWKIRLIEESNPEWRDHPTMSPSHETAWTPRFAGVTEYW